MSSCRGSVCLLVLLGIVFAFGSPVHHIEFPGRLKQIHNDIADKLDLGTMDAGNRLFSSVMKTINTSCQVKEDVQMMKVTLNIYERIFSSILQNRTTLLGEKLKSDLQALQKETETLKIQLNTMDHHREDVIGKLNNINVEDAENQRKALAEFKEVYQAASVVASHRCGASAE